MTNPDSPALDLDALTALEKAATPGPWRLDREYAYDEYAVYSPNGAVGLAWSLDDAELIAAARNALPALLSALAAVTAERDRAAAKRDEWQRSCDHAGQAIVEIQHRLNATIDEQAKELAAAREQLAAVTAERDVHRYEVGHADAEREEAEGNRDAARAELATVTEQRDQLARAFRAEQEETRTQSARWVSAQDQIEHAKRQRDEAIEQAKQAQAELAAADGWIERVGMTVEAIIVLAEDKTPGLALLADLALWNDRRRALLADAASTAVPRATCTAYCGESGHTHVPGQCVLAAAPKADPDQPNDFDPVTGRIVPVVYPNAAAPKAACSCQWSPVRGRIWCDSCAAARDAVVEAAAAPQADEQPSTWPDCGRGVRGGWCRHPVNHQGDCSPKSRRLALPTICPAEYTRPGGRQRGDRIVRCHLPYGHPGEHEEAETECTWLDEPLPAAAPDPAPRCSLPVQQGQWCGMVSCRKGGCRVGQPVPAGGEDGSGTADGRVPA